MADQERKLNGSGRRLKIRRRCLRFCWYAFMALVAAGIVGWWAPSRRSDCDLENLFAFVRMCILIGLGTLAAFVGCAFIFYERRCGIEVFLASLAAVGVGLYFPFVFAMITYFVSVLMGVFGMDLFSVVNVEEATFALVFCSAWLTPVVMVVAFTGSFRRNWREGLVVGVLLQGLGALLVCVYSISSSDSVGNWCFIWVTEVLAGGCAGAVGGVVRQRLDKKDQTAKA